MRDVYLAITAASYSGNKGAAAMLQSSIEQLYKKYGNRLNILLMSVYPDKDSEQVPWDFVRVVPAKAQQIVFCAFPLAILYKIFKWCLPIRWLLQKNHILKAYTEVDAVLDEAGVSFVDSRGFIMNTYAFISMAIPLLMGIPVIKYSQAMGTFDNPVNRLQAKIILPKIRLICARGEITRDNLRSIGITENVKVCADGAFTMENMPDYDDVIARLCKEDSFYVDNNIVGISPSVVIFKKCRKKNIDYLGVLAGFVNELIKRGYRILIFANSAREGSTNTRNNDLMLCNELFGMIHEKEQVRWNMRELSAEELRVYESRCRFVVASRFHAMIGALSLRIPVLLVGWSHKYQEVLDYYELGNLSIDYSGITLDGLMKCFEVFVDQEDFIRRQLDLHNDRVMESSRENIVLATEVIDEIVSKTKSYKLLDYSNPSKYLGQYRDMRMGYAFDEKYRENAASGGMITAFLCYLLNHSYIDGALVSRAIVSGGRVITETFIAVTEEEILSASSSVYMTIPMMKYVDMIRQFNGRIAIVAVPCMLKQFDVLMVTDTELRSRIAYKIGLFCSGNSTPRLTELALRKAKVPLDRGVRIYYRRGHWRGKSAVEYEDGTCKTFSYSKIICAYKNAFFFEQDSCMYCQDHFANFADISFGDVWLSTMKREPIKHTSCLLRSEDAAFVYEEAVKEGVIVDKHIAARDMIRSQKRALVFKYNCASAKVVPNDTDITGSKLDGLDKCRINHKLAFRLAEFNHRFSKEHYGTIRKIPVGLVYLYMCFIRFLLNF